MLCLIIVIAATTVMLGRGDRVGLGHGRGRVYEIEDRLGRGGFGVVYKASRSDGFGHFAIKVLDTAQMNRHMLERVRQEISVHARLEHPSIVKLEDVFEEDNRICIVLEYCSGGDLTKFLRKPGTVSEVEARTMVLQVAEGVAYLHKHGIMHRDLAMGNILLDADGHCKICDFGLAVEMRRPNETHLTMCGTPNAISPEVASGTEYGLKADIWGLGVILYTLLVGKAPFDDGRVKSTIEKVIHHNPEFPPTLSQNAVHLINGMLQKDDSKRFSLEKILSHPFLCLSTPPSSLLTSSDSGFGTTTLSSNGQPPFSSTRQWPDIRQPLLGNISEVCEEKRSFCGLSRARSATPIIPQPSPIAAPKYSSAESVVIGQREERPRSASLDRGPAAPWGGRVRTATAPPTSSPQVPLEPQINALRLKPQRRPQRIRSGISAAVLASGEVELDIEIKKKGMRMRVSRDGWNISIDKTTQGQDEVESYTYKSLPKCYWQKYNILAKVVRRWRETTPKVTFSTEDARCDLMENEPVANFKVAFSDGTRIDYCSANGQITYKASERTSSLTFSYPFTSSSIDKGILVYLKNFEKWHELCKTIEKQNTIYGVDIFPLVAGRKPKGLATSTSIVSAATTTLTTTTVAPAPAPTSATAMSRLSVSVSAAVNVSHISRDSKERGAYRIYKFPDGTVLELPKDTSDTRFRYRNRHGHWETNYPQLSMEMQEKMDQIVDQMYKSRNKLLQLN